jgi:hypothetical protein
MISRQIWVLLFLLLYWVWLSQGEGTNQLQRVRFGFHGAFSRVVFDLQAYSTYQVVRGQEAFTIVVEFAPLALPSHPSYRARDPLIREVRLFPTPTSVRGEIRLKKPGTVHRHFFLDDPPRIVVDVTPRQGERETTVSMPIPQTTAPAESVSPSQGETPPSEGEIWLCTFAKLSPQCIENEAAEYCASLGLAPGCLTRHPAPALSALLIDEINVYSTAWTGRLVRKPRYAVTAGITGVALGTPVKVVVQRSYPGQQYQEVTATVCYIHGAGTCSLSVPVDAHALVDTVSVSLENSFALLPAHTITYRWEDTSQSSR